MSNSLQPHGLHSPWNSPEIHGEEPLQRYMERVAVPFPRGIFPTQGLNPGPLHCRQILYELSHQGSPRILEWAATLFTSGPS